jgi:hypothetical protein
MKVKTLIVGLIIVFLSAITSWAISLVDAEWLKVNLDKKNMWISPMESPRISYQ